MSRDAPYFSKLKLSIAWLRIKSLTLPDFPIWPLLSNLLFEQVGLNKTESKEMVEAFFEQIKIALENGESVKLSGFGNFELRAKSERPGRNPKTGEKVIVDEKKSISFKMSKDLFNEINNE